MERPPCFELLGVTPCLRRQHDWNVSGNGPLNGPWSGWKIAGDFLVCPEGSRVHIGRVKAVMRSDSLSRIGTKKRTGNVLSFKAKGP